MGRGEEEEMGGDTEGRGEKETLKRERKRWTRHRR